MVRVACGFVLFLLLVATVQSQPRRASSVPRVKDAEPAHPIQLIYPSEGHETLLINEAALATLAAISKPVAIVAVCGPLHSGKSFLMNQLLGRTSGFALGATTEPQTRGLWMWSKPIETKDHVIVFLDTEGLFASNTSELYDAKIFAISNLLSSYLIYNSVKIIDQSAIDYIELLARRAHLFLLKAELDKKTNELPASLLAPPKLLWIVQDFVSEIEDGVTAREWLNRLLAYRKKSENSASSLPELFDDIDCFTLFLPEYRKENLRHLDKVGDEDLLPEYRSEMKKLREKVISNAKVKVQHRVAVTSGRELSATDGSKLNGAGAAALLRLLVTAANEGAFPEVPSLWNSFLQLQAQNALKDALEFFQTSLSENLNAAPITTPEFAELTQKYTDETHALYRNLVFGFKDLESQNKDAIDESIKKAAVALKAANKAQLDRLCADAFRVARNEFKQKLAAIKKPIRKRDLTEKAKQLHAKLEAQFAANLTKYTQEEEYSKYAEDLTIAMKGERASVENKNSELLLQVVATSSQKSLAEVKSYLAKQDTKKQGLGSNGVQRTRREAQNVGNDMFTKLAAYALEDMPTAPSLKSDLNTKIMDAIEQWVAENDFRISERAMRTSDELARELSRLIESISLPQPKTTIQSTIEGYKKDFIAKFKTAISDVVDMPAAKPALEKLLKSSDADHDEALRRNNVKYDRILENSLPTLRLNLAPQLSTFIFPHQAINFAKNAAKNVLTHTEKMENLELIEELSSRFVESSLSSEIQWIRIRLYATCGCLAFVSILALFGVVMRKK